MSTHTNIIDFNSRRSGKPPSKKPVHEYSFGVLVKEFANLPESSQCHVLHTFYMELAEFLKTARK